MALVADYSSCSESENEEEEKKETHGGEKEKLSHHDVDDTEAAVDDDIIDEDEDHRPGGSFQNNNSTTDGPSSILDEATEDIPGMSSSNVSFFSALPSSSLTKPNSGGPKKDFIDENEDLESIPTAKASEKALIPMKPPVKKRKGPVKIMLPSLSDFGQDDDEDAEASGPQMKKFRGAQKSSTLLSLLPTPKNGFPSRMSVVGNSSTSSASTSSSKRMLVPDSVSRKPNIPAGLVPRQVKSGGAGGKVKGGAGGGRKPGSDSDSDDDDDNAPKSFFTLESEKITPIAPPVASTSIQVSNPHDILGSSAAGEPEAGPSIGPSMPQRPEEQVNLYPEANDLMANSDALERLAGKNAIRNQKETPIAGLVEVNADDLTADPRDWMTKAMTEDDPDRPGPKCTVKGTTKRKHQITYLAAMAKENEHKLRQQWANNAATKKAAGNKYGF